MEWLRWLQNYQIMSKTKVPNLRNGRSVKVKDVDSYYWKIWNKLMCLMKKPNMFSYVEVQYSCINSMMQLRVRQPAFLSCHIFCAHQYQQNPNQIVIGPNDALNRVNYIYCQEERIKVMFGAKGVKLKDQYYPAICASCRKNNDDEMFAGVPGEPSKITMTILKQEIAKYKENSPDKNDFSSKKCKNSLGQCAEFHAANRIIKKTKTEKLNELLFSLAIRPRTMLVYAYCGNCQAVFPYCKIHSPIECHCNNEKCRINS